MMAYIHQLYRAVLCSCFITGFNQITIASENDSQIKITEMFFHQAALEIVRMEVCAQDWDYRLDHYNNSYYKTKEYMHMARFAGLLEDNVRFNQYQIDFSVAKTPSLRINICGSYKYIDGVFIPDVSNTIGLDIPCVIGKQCVDVNVFSDFHTAAEQIEESIYHDPNYKQEIRIRNVIKATLTPDVAAPTFGPNNPDDKKWIEIFGTDSKVAWFIRNQVVADMALIDKQYFPFRLSSILSQVFKPSGP